MHFFATVFFRYWPVNVHSPFFRCEYFAFFRKIEIMFIVTGQQYNFRSEIHGKCRNIFQRACIILRIFPTQQMHLNEFVAASEELKLAVIVSRADYILPKPCFARFIATMRFRHGKSTTQHILHSMHSKPQAPIEICVFIQ